MRKLFTIILLAILCANAMAYDFSAVCSTGQTLYYNITSDVEPYTVEVTSENADGFYTTYPTGDLEIPETVEYNSITYSVTRIGDKAFNGCGELTSVSIPNSVTSIGEYAFEDCTELTSVTIPNSVTSIDSYAFLYCNGLETIIIGSGVTNIGTDAFAGCSILTSISVEESNSTFDSRDNCNAIIQTETNILVLGCKNTTIPNSVTSIGEDAFYGSDLESITIPNSVTTIANGAFSNCINLTEITIPESVTSIGIYRYVFSECVALESIIVDANNTTYDSRDNCNAIIETETNTLIAGCKGTIIPNSVENISHAAFMGSGLRKVYIPNSVTNIANEVFYGCRSLTSVTIGSSVTEIGELAFYECVNITEINLSTTTPPALGENVFTETIYNSATVWVPRGSGGIYMNTEFWTQFSTIREVPYYWLCNFEDEETWTLGNDQQYGNVQWQILTRETYPSSLYTSDNDAYIRPFVFYGDTLNNTPGHWAMADLISQVASFGGPGQVAESPWIEFSNINLIEAEQPQITFRQIFRQLNGVETSIRVSIDGGQTWTDHIVNEEVESNTYGEYEIRTGIREAAGEGNVKIRFLINSDAHAVQMGYGWEIDDIEIKEAPDTIIATAGEGGTISPNGEVLVDIGESVTFTITPNDGYRIASVMVDETENVTDQLVDGTYTFVDVIENHTIAATFEEIHTYTIIVLSNNDAYGFVSDGGTFEEGAVFMIEAMPNDGYRFVSWNDGNTENPRTITVTSDSTFVAIFRDINVHWSCDFEEGNEIWTFGNDQQTGNVQWQIVTPDTYSEMLLSDYMVPFIYDGDTLCDTPEHWAVVDLISQHEQLGGPGQVAESPYIEFSGIDLSNTEHPQLRFRQIYMHLNTVETLIRVSTDGGNSWTDHIVNPDVQSNKYGIYFYTKGNIDIFEATGYHNVSIRFYMNSEGSGADEGYGWELDDIQIIEAPQCDLKLQEARISMFGYIDYRNVPDDFRPTITDPEERREAAYHYYDPYSQSPRKQWATESGYAAFNVEVSSYGYDTVTPMARITIVNPNDEEIYDKVSSGIRGLAINERDTVDFFNSFSFYFEDIESYEDIAIGRYTVKFYVYADGIEDADTTDNYATQYFDITDKTFSLSYNEPTESFDYLYYVNSSSGDEYGMSFTYGYQPEEIIEVDVYIDSITTPGAMAQAIIYKYNDDGVPAEIIGSSDTLVITSDMLGSWVNFPLNGYVNSDTAFMVAIRGIWIDGQQTFAVGASDVLTSKGYKSCMRFQTQGDTWYYGAPQLAIRVREVMELNEYNIVVLSSNDAYGTVSGGGTYEDGDTIIITAIPNGGYLFDSWEDDNAENPRTITVTSDSTFVADFVKCEITQTIDTTVNNFVTVGEHTFYSTGNYSFSVLSENDCDTIFDIRLRVLAEPVYDIGPNPTEKILNITSDSFISYVEFYSPTGQLVMRKEVNGYEAVFDMEGLVDGVYILRIYGEESSLPAVSKIIKE